MKLRLLDNTCNVCLVLLRIDNLEHRALVDTGASLTSIDPILLRANAHKKLTSTIRTSTSGGLVHMYRVCQPFKLGSVILHQVMVNNLLELHKNTDLHFTIIIGQDILRQYQRVTIDYVTKTIEFVV